MTAKPLTIVLFDRSDAESVEPNEYGDCIFAALTPSASEAARARGIDVLSHPALFSDRDQLRCVVAGRGAVRSVDNSAIMSSLSPSIRLLARQSLWQMAYLEHRLRRTLPHGPWFVRGRNGAWATAPDRHSLLEILLPRIWEYGRAHVVPAGRPPAAMIFRWLQRRAARSAGRSKSTKVVSVTQKLRSGWREAVRDAGASLVVLQPTSGSWQDYRNLLKRRGNSAALFVTPLPADDPLVCETVSKLRAFGSTIGDGNLAFAWLRYVPYFSKIVPTMLGTVTEGAHLLRLIDARAAFGFEANSWLGASLNEAAGLVEIPRVVLNHNSQPPSGQATADEVLSTLFEQRTYNELVDIAGIWSPSSLKWAGKRSRRTIECQSVRFEYPVIDPQTTAKRPFRILHAGNYQNWSDYFPWISETSDEFLNGMERLADASNEIEDIEIIFRVRPKREVDAETIRGRLAGRHNLRICDTEEDFLEQLAGCDLLVAHFSTTVEQALQMGKPVLLWGSAQRFRQFEGRNTLPDFQSRAAVYAVSDERDLPAMLAAIRDVHHGRPLTEGEAGLYRHPRETPSIGEWTRALLCKTASC